MQKIRIKRWSSARRVPVLAHHRLDRAHVRVGSPGTSRSPTTTTSRRPASIARSFYDLTIEFRRWGSLHGGVYVPVTGSLQPNPISPSLSGTSHHDGQKAHARESRLDDPPGLRAHRQRRPLPIITTSPASNTSSDQHKPDAWEADALGKFEAGQRGISEETTISSEPYMRIMRPLQDRAGVPQVPRPRATRSGTSAAASASPSPSSPTLRPKRRNRRPHGKPSAPLVHRGRRHHAFAGTSGASSGIAWKPREVPYPVREQPPSMWVYDIESLRFMTVTTRP